MSILKVGIHFKDQEGVEKDEKIPSCLAGPEKLRPHLGPAPLPLHCSYSVLKLENFHMEVRCHTVPETFSEEARHSSQRVSPN